MYKRASFSIAAALLLSACSSGSGVTPIQNGTASNVQAVSVQRSEAASGLSAAQAMQSGGPGGAVILSTISRQGAIRLLHATGAPSKNMTFSEADLTWSACSNGRETGYGVSNATDYESGVRTYYDAACTQLAQDAYIHETNTTPGSLNGANITVTGTVLKQSQAGAVVSYDTLTGTLTGSTSTLQATLQFAHAANQTAAPSAQYGESCSITMSEGPNAAPQTCGLGSVAHVQSASADVGSTMSISVTTGSTSTVTGTVNVYAGAYNALTLAAGTFPAWTVSGGQPLSSATLTGTQGQTSTFTIVDSKTDATVHITSSNSITGGVTGTIVRTSTGATVATFTADMYGNGTITYSNGTTANIVDWVVTG